MLEGLYSRSVRPGLGGFLLWWQRFWQRFAWQHIFTHGSVVDERCQHRRRLHEIAGLRVIVNIQFRMMRARSIVERVLNELEPRQPHRVEGKMIRAAGVANRNRARAQILERREPGFEDGPHHVIALEMNAPDLSG